MDFGDPIPLPKIKRDALGMAYVDGETGPEPFRHPKPDRDGWPDVKDHFWFVDRLVTIKPREIELPTFKVLSPAQ